LGDVRFTPKVDIRQHNRDVRFVPKADIPHLLTKQLGVSIFMVVAERKEQHNEEQRHKIAEPA
jgi:LytS/YehU family sensor histidine kinase